MKNDKLRMAVRAVCRAALTAAPPAWATSVWLLKIMVPVSLAVCLMQHYGLIAALGRLLSPLLTLVGLPGEAAVPFVSGALAGTYGGIAAMTGMALTLRQATIVSLMICLCHALPMESAVVRKTGSSFWLMSVLRVAMALVCAFYLNIVLPEMDAPFSMGYHPAASATLAGDLWLWAGQITRLSALAVGIIYSLMVVQRLLEACDGIRWLSRFLRPLMRVFGLPPHAAYLWLVGNVLGISYGSAVMLDLENRGVLTRAEANEANYHLIMNHSLVEDTLVFAAIGIGVFWIVSTRVLFALAVVWGKRAWKRALRAVDKCASRS